MTLDDTHETATESVGHYRTAGTSLILLGVINAAVAGTSMVTAPQNAFIGFDMMLTFGVAFIAVGVWMRTYSPDE